MRAILFLFCLFVSFSIFSSELKPWPVKISSGKGDDYFTITKMMSLPALSQSIYPVDNDSELNGSVIDKAKKLKIDFIGEVSGAKVYDIIYPLQNSAYGYLKSIVLEREPERYVPVYYVFIDDRYLNHSLNTINRSIIILNTRLIESRLQMQGSGGYWDNFYLYVPPDILQNKKEVPKIVDLNVINEILSKKLPGYYAPEGEPFNMNTLHFHSCVTKTAAHCFPDSDDPIVDMQFKLVEGELQLVSFLISRKSA